LVIALERLEIRSIRFEFGNHLVPVGSHFYRVVNRPGCLLLQSACPAVPKLGKTQAGVKDGGSIHRPPLAPDAFGYGQAVNPAPVQVVAGGAGKAVVVGQALVKEKPLSERNFLGRKFGGGRQGQNRVPAMRCNDKGALNLFRKRRELPYIVAPDRHGEQRSNRNHQCRLPQFHRFL